MLIIRVTKSLPKLMRKEGLHEVYTEIYYRVAAVTSSEESGTVHKIKVDPVLTTVLICIKVMYS